MVSGLYAFPLVLMAVTIWINVPFVPQTEEGCGAASIVMVMRYWESKGHQLDPDSVDLTQIMAQLYSKEDRGITAAKLTSHFTKHGFQTFPFSGNWNDLSNHLVKGRPLLVAIESRGRAGLHYLVLAGINPEENFVLVNDPAQRKLLRMERADFEKRWSATQNWTLLAVPDD